MKPGKVLSHVALLECMSHNIVDGLKKTAKKRIVFREEMSEFCINGKDTMSMLVAEELKAHGYRAFQAVLYTTGAKEHRSLSFSMFSISMTLG